jgi:hypothetical protein
MKTRREPPSSPDTQSKYHVGDKILNNVSKGVQTRRRVCFFCQHTSFVSSIEPMKANEALQDPNRLIVVQQELDNFSHIKVWMLMESCDPKQHIIIGTCGSS